MTLLYCVLFLFIFSFAFSLDFSGGTYNELTVSIDSKVPKENCKDILLGLENSLSRGSDAIYRSLRGRASWKTITVLVPNNWPDSCVPGQNPDASKGETADVIIGLPHPVYKDTPWTQQSKPCGHQGDFISLSYRLFLQGDSEPKQKLLARRIAKEWAKYRYGVFDEIGYPDDPIYPSCYNSDFTEDMQVNGCSDKPIEEKGMCRTGKLNITMLTHQDAQTSLMFTNQHKVDKFCDASTHDRFSPTKQNNICDRKSIMQIINQHVDFSNGTLSNEPINTTPKITYKREILTRYVLVIEDSKDMNIRGSWFYLRLAIRKWLLVQLQGQVEVALVSANESAASVLQRLTPLHTTATKDLLASNVPYTPGDARTACLSCGINAAMKLLNDQANMNGPSSSVIVVIAPGTLEHTPDLTEIMGKLKQSQIRIATITYPAQVRARSLDWMAEATGGSSYTVMEHKYNMATSYISTYFKLTNVFGAIQQTYYQGDKSELPVEIYRKEVIDNGKTTVVGSFVLDEWMGEPAKFTVLTHNTDSPLIRSISLVSPSHKVYSTRSDALLSLKLLTVPANINETGTWTYTIDIFPGSPQPHYVQVMATPRSHRAPIVSSKFYTAQINKNLILYTQVKRGEYPVLGAKVEVVVTKIGINGSTHKEKFELMDTGSGDPDLMKGDGIYSRYFNAWLGGTGDYTFEVTVSDNGNTAYSWQINQNEDVFNTDIHCCGSIMPAPTVEPLSPFQQILPPQKIYVEKIDNVLGSVKDLRAVIIPNDLKARLVWTSPDMGGKPVSRYELIYSKKISDIIDHFGSSNKWLYGEPFPLTPGSETTFTLDFKKNLSLLDKNLYFAIRGYTELLESAIPGQISNWVRVKIPSPAPPPPIRTSTSTQRPNSRGNEISPTLSSFSFSLEFILPILIGVIILILAVIIYCYLCMKKKTVIKEVENTHPEKTMNISIVPTETNNVTPPQNNYDINNMNMMSNPPQYELRVEDANNRCSMTIYDGNDLQNYTVQPVQEYERMGNLRDKTLSPYQSWTASQLLHEHERRYSPYGQVEDFSQYYSPPVPPLPLYQQQDIYGISHQIQYPPPNQFMNYQPDPNMTYNPSLQGSITSMNSDKKRRNVTII